LTNTTSKLSIFIVNNIIIRSCTIHLSTTSKPCSPSRIWFLKICPRKLLTIYTCCLGKMMWSCWICSPRMSSKNAHFITVRNLRKIIAIILEFDIVNKCLKIKSLSSTYNIEIICHLSQWEWLTCYCSWEHSNSMCILTVWDFLLGITSRTVFSWETCEIWIS